MGTREVEVIPNPAGTLTALAGGGYSVHSAIADLIDNAISGGAATVDIRLDIAGQGTLVIADDGQGMDNEALIHAMQVAAGHGKDRVAGDLGRFGTGMKAAGIFLSNRGRFTIASAALQGRGTAATLDVIQMKETGRWIIAIEDNIPMQRGTVITIDAPLMALQPDPASAALKSLSEHLRCTFATHMDRGLILRVQDHLLIPWPLCSPDLPEISSLSTRLYDRGRVRITPFILPTHRDEALTEGPLGRHEHAGFHVHRAGRALTLGGWHGIRAARSDTAIKDRVRMLVEIGPELDREWRVTLPKSGYTIPDDMKPRIRRLLDETLDRAGRQRNAQLRSTTAGDSQVEGLWTRRGLIRREHPLIQRVLASSRDGSVVELLLTQLEEEHTNG